MDLGGIGWLDGQDIWVNIRRLKEHYDTSLVEPATFAPEVAVIVDERSALGLACNRTLMYPQGYTLRARFYRMGAPVRMHYLGDLLSGRMPPARVYIFVNPFYVDRAARDAIARATAGKTAVYSYGSGFLNEGADDRLVSELIGMPVHRINGKGAEVTFLPGENPLLDGLSDAPFGTKAELDPLWAVDAQSGVTPLAARSDGEILVAAKRDTNGLRVYVGTTDVPAAFLRNVLKVSGGHIYVDSDDVVSSDDHFLALTATAAGTKQITLRKPATVRDLYGDRTQGTDISSFEVPMAKGETRLFVLSAQD
jgi:hypothetical protein